LAIPGLARGSANGVAGLLQQQRLGTVQHVKGSQTLPQVGLKLLELESHAP